MLQFLKALKQFRSNTLSHNWRKLKSIFSTADLFHKNGNIASEVFELKVQLTKVSPETEHQNILATGCRGVCNDQ